MNIHFIGHSAFMLEHGQTRLLIDPFIQGNPQAAVTCNRRSTGTSRLS